MYQPEKRKKYHLLYNKKCYHLEYKIIRKHLNWRLVLMLELTLIFVKVGWAIFVWSISMVQLWLYLESDQFFMQDYVSLIRMMTSMITDSPKEYHSCFNFVQAKFIFGCYFKVHSFFNIEKRWQLLWESKI